MIIDRLLSDGCEAGMHLPTEISLVLRICSVAFLSISKKWYRLKALIGQIPHQPHYLGHLGQLSIFEILHQPLQTLIFVPNPERDCTRLLRLGCNYIPQQSCAQTPFERNESKHETSKEVLNTMHIQQSISLTVSQNCVYISPCFHFLQESGILLSRPWTEEEDIVGRAVSFFEIGGYLAQLLVALCMGPLINMFATINTVMVVSFVGMVLATICCWNVVTEESSQRTSKHSVVVSQFLRFLQGSNDIDS